MIGFLRSSSRSPVQRDSIRLERYQSSCLVLPFFSILIRVYLLCVCIPLSTPSFHARTPLCVSHYPLRVCIPIRVCVPLRVRVNSTPCVSDSVCISYFPLRVCIPLRVCVPLCVSSIICTPLRLHLTLCVSRSVCILLPYLPSPLGAPPRVWRKFGTSTPRQASHQS